jgi:tetratricopeptide (TPR) repeat protein
MTASTLNLLQEAVVSHRAGRLAEAIAIDLISRAIGINPGAASYHVNLAQALIAAGEDERAVEALRLAAMRNPTAQDCRLIATLCEQLGRGADAIAFARRAATLEPANYFYQSELARLLAGQGRLQDAYVTMTVALGIRPESAEALQSLGEICLKLSRHEEALEHFRLACQLEPESTGARLRIGSVYLRMGRIEEAEQLFRRDIERNPDLAAPYSSLAEALRRRGMFEEAIEACNRAIALKEDDAEAHVIKSQAELAMGDLAHGWSDLAARGRLAQFAVPHRHLARPIWDGSPLTGRTLLVWTEGDWGDAILFSRYAAVAAETGTVVVEAPAALHPILRRAAGVSEVLTPDDPLPVADVGAGLLSLPLIMGSTLESIPKNVPYISAEPALVEEWRGRIGGESEMKRVGIVWSGETTDGTPVSGGPAVHRVNLGPILNTPGIRFVGLHPESDASGGDELVDVSAMVRDLGDMAAILESLDLLIAVD